MSLETSFLSLDELKNDYENYPVQSINPQSGRDLCKTIFTNADRYYSAMKNINLSRVSNQTDIKILIVVQSKNMAIPSFKAGGSGEVRIEGSWGGKDGPDVNVSVSAEVHDSQGNYVEAEVSQDSSGEGSASVSAGHEEGK